MHNNRAKIAQGQQPKVSALNGANLFQNNFILNKNGTGNMVKTFYGGSKAQGQGIASPIIVGNQFAQYNSNPKRAGAMQL
jgi:hypothetical protein